MADPNAFTGAALDRGSDRERQDPRWLREQYADARARALVAGSARSHVGWGGRVARCRGCGASARPRADPVGIMLGADGRERVLLGRQPSWPTGRCSALAGFVAPGESLEEAVAREVYEEARVH